MFPSASYVRLEMAGTFVSASVRVYWLSAFESYSVFTSLCVVLATVYSERLPIVS